MTVKYHAEIQLTNNVDAVTDRVIAGAVKGLNLAAERLLALAVDRSPASNQATLRGSGTVVNATEPDEGAGVVFDTPYAARLHEHPEYNFDKRHNPNAQGKYIEDPAVENKDELGDIIAAQIRRADGTSL